VRRTLIAAFIALIALWTLATIIVMEMHK